MSLRHAINLLNMVKLRNSLLNKAKRSLIYFRIAPAANQMQDKPMFTCITSFVPVPDISAIFT